MSAAGCYAVAQVPSLPPYIKASFEIGAAISFALLGMHASDCPPNCPGTDEAGRPRGRRIPVSFLFALWAAGTVSLIALSGCITRNPSAGQGDPPAPQYTVNPRLTEVSNVVHGVAQVLAPLPPVGPALPSAVEVIFGAVGALSLLYARHKSALATSLASSIARSGESVTTAVHYNAGATPKAAEARRLITEQANRVRPPAAPARNIPVDNPKPEA